jgi:hypothetical protein
MLNAEPSLTMNTDTDFCSHIVRRCGASAYWSVSNRKTEYIRRISARHRSWFSGTGGVYLEIAEIVQKRKVMDYNGKYLKSYIVAGVGKR